MLIMQEPIWHHLCFDQALAGSEKKNISLSFVPVYAYYILRSFKNKQLK